MDKVVINSANVKFQETPSSGIHAAQCEETDGYDDANCRFYKLLYEA
jgi:hypothetical protein